MSRNQNLSARNGQPRSSATPGSGAGNGDFNAPATILTNMEYRVLSRVAAGDSNKEIAAAIGISPATVKRHIENLLRKLKLRNRIEAAVYGAMIEGCPAPHRTRLAFEAWRRSQKPED
jgi:DNA-binding NarL/FixJ family response regulator